jgi:hypothetical protein
MFDLMFRVHEWENLNAFNIVKKVDALRVLDSLEFFLLKLIQEAESTVFPSRSLKLTAINNYKLISKFVKKTIRNLNFFDVLKSLYLCLEIYYGSKAHKKGTEAYAKFKKKWHSEKYSHLHLRGIR